MNICLLGYGKMGQAIEKEALERGHQIVFKIDLNNLDEWEQVQAHNTDVIIEFSHPDSFQDNFGKVMAKSIPLVCGTTGWYDRLPFIRESVLESQNAMVYASNFSLGVNLMFRLNSRLAELMNPYDAYDVFVEEQHHRYKADGPSGTAYSLAVEIIQKLDRKSRTTDSSLRHRAPEPDELSVGFVRSGDIIGTHKVTYTSAIDSISIMHQAHNRRGFALGAVIAAEWIADKKGFYEFQQIL